MDNINTIKAFEKGKIISIFDFPKEKYDDEGKIIKGIMHIAAINHPYYQLKLWDLNKEIEEIFEMEGPPFYIPGDLSTAYFIIPSQTPIITSFGIQNIEEIIPTEFYDISSRLITILKTKFIPDSCGYEDDIILNEISFIGLAKKEITDLSKLYLFNININVNENTRTFWSSELPGQTEDVFCTFLSLSDGRLITKNFQYIRVYKGELYSEFTDYKFEGLIDKFSQYKDYLVGITFDKNYIYVWDIFKIELKFEINLKSIIKSQQASIISNFYTRNDDICILIQGNIDYDLYEISITNKKTNLISNNRSFDIIYYKEGYGMICANSDLQLLAFKEEDLKFKVID